MIIEVDL